MEFDSESRRKVTSARPPMESDRATDEPKLPARTVSRLSTRSAMALQGKAGNRAVSRLVAQRKAATAAPAAKPAAAKTSAQPAAPSTGTATPASTSADLTAGLEQAAEVDGAAGFDHAAVHDSTAGVVQRAVDAPARPGPSADPKFTALKRDVKSKQQTMGKHPPAKAEADAAAKAAKPPQDDKQAQGKAANAEKMNAAKPGEFDKAAFIAAVNAAIAKQAPKNLEEADEFGSSGKAEAVKGEVAGKVEGGKKASAGQIESTTKAPPDTGAAKDKPVTPLKPDQPPGKPGTPDPANAVPDKAPPAATDFSAGPKQVNDQMADAQVTEDQLAKSNEPEFTGALKEKKAGEVHAATAPGEVRGKEAATIAGAKAEAQQSGATAMTAMTAARGKSGKEMDAGKGGAQSEDEKKRAQVTAKLQTVFDATKKDVEDILTGLDKKVDDKFTKDEKAARDAFTADHKKRMDAYKDKRYSGWTGGLKWAKDKLLGMPEEANQIFVVARQGYVTAMQGVISGVADLIGTELNAAKARIAKGRTDLKAEVDKLPQDLQALGKEAAGEFAGKFDELTESVDAKGSELVDTLASKYTEALKSVDEEIAAEKEKNKGLVAKAIDAVKGVIETILKLKDLLLGVLAKAAQAIGAIIKDPIGFLGNLVSAVGAGLKAFISNIGTHLKKGLVSWLLGTAAKAGLQLPEKFDLKGILGLIASLLGLTWASIRGRIVAKGVPEKAMGAVESGVPLVQKLMTGGIGGLWEDIKDQIGDLKETLLGKISEYLIPTVLMAGITWIVSLLNPASAFIKACKAIIDIVTFIIERGAQILEFVNAVLDAVIAIAGGGAGGVPGLIEAALAKSVPVLIGFLAALLGIGGIAEKVKKIFQALSKPVMKAVDWIVGKIVGFGKKIWAKLKSKAGSVRDKIRGGDDSPEGKKQRLDKGMAAAVSATNRFKGSAVGRMALKPVLAGIRVRYGLTSLEPVLHGDRWAVRGKVNPEDERETEARATSPAAGDAGPLGPEQEKYLAKIAAAMPKHGVTFANDAREKWAPQLAKAKANGAPVWSGDPLAALDPSGDLSPLDKPDTHRALLPFFAGSKREREADTKVFFAHVFKNATIRSGFLKTIGQAALKLLKGATRTTDDATLAGQVANIGFNPDDGTHGKFVPLPGDGEKEDADLAAAVGDNIVTFLETMVTTRRVGNVSWSKFKELWEVKENRDFLKTKFRGVKAGHHEWIPTNYIQNVLERAVYTHKAGEYEQALDWVRLHNALRSKTYHVLYQIQGVEPRGHVGSFFALNPGAKPTQTMFQGDGPFHDELRKRFDRHRGTARDFAAKLLSELESSDLMWKGGVETVPQNLRDVAIGVLYTSKDPTLGAMTFRTLAERQEENFLQIKADFVQAEAALKG